MGFDSDCWRWAIRKCSGCTCTAPVTAFIGWDCPEEQEQYFCPVCLQACKVSVLAEGFTKQALPFAPELIDAPLPRWWVARIGADLEGERVHRARTPRRYIRRAVAAS